jgi:hypothetical protein
LKNGGIIMDESNFTIFDDPDFLLGVLSDDETSLNGDHVIQTTITHPFGEKFIAGLVSEIVAWAEFIGAMEG